MSSAFGETGFKLEKLGKGRNAIQSKVANELVRALNQVGTITVIRGQEDKVIYGDNGVIIQLKNSDSAAAGGDTVDLIVCSEGDEVTYRLYGSII